MAARFFCHLFILTLSILSLPPFIFTLFILMQTLLMYLHHRHEVFASGLCPEIIPVSYAYLGCLVTSLRCMSAPHLNLTMGRSQALAASGKQVNSWCEAQRPPIVCETLGLSWLSITNQSRKKLRSARKNLHAHIRRPISVGLSLLPKRNWRCK